MSSSRPQKSKTRASASSNRGPSPARDAATRIVSRVLDEKLFLDDAEAREAALLSRLSRADRALAKRLALEALRRLGEIDALIAAHLAHDLPEDAGAICAILRVLAAETVFLGAPAYAAVGEAVTLARRAEPRFAGLVNAVGRRIAASAPGDGAPADPSEEARAARLNTPDWLWDALVSNWGEETAERIALGHTRGASLDLTLKNPAKAQALATVLGGAVTPAGGVRVKPSGPVTELPGYADGLWWVQDAAAALPARLAEAGKGTRALDLCAAPGGKTLQLAATGAAVTALDASERRIARVKENLARVKLDATLVVADARDWRPPDGARFDAVVLDAPCTATGTIRRHPDLPHVKDLSALDALVELQEALLEAAWALVAPGGRLVFCTCSLLRAEGEDLAERALKRWVDATAPPIAPEILGLPARSADQADAASDASFRPARLAQPADLALGRLRTTPASWPRHGGADGFFAARFVKAEPEAGAAMSKG